MASGNPLSALRRLGEGRSRWGGARNRSRPEWYLGPHARSDAPGIVVGGAPRSGTTLVRVMLDSHPQLRCGPESMLFEGRLVEERLSRLFDVSRADIRELERSSASFPEFVTRFLGEYARRQGAPHWAEKTPANVRNLGWILDRFPKVTFCHVIRDGRAVVSSLRTHPRHRMEGGRLVPTGILRDLDECIDRWLGDLGAGLEFSGHPRVLEVRYEDVVADPEASLTPLLARLGLTWSPEMARFEEVHRPSRDVSRFPQNPEATRPLSTEALDRWRRELTAEQVARIEERGAEAQARLGYA